MSATSQPGREVVHRPLVRGLLEHRDDLVALLLGPPRGRVVEDVAHHLGRVGGVVDERLRADRDLVAEQGGDLVRVARCSRRSGAAPPSRRCRATSSVDVRRRRTSTRRAGTSAAATRAAARTRCPARAPAWRRIRPGEAACPRWGVLPMFRGGARTKIVSRRSRCTRTRVADGAHHEGGRHGCSEHHRGMARSGWE